MDSLKFRHAQNQLCKILQVILIVAYVQFMSCMSINFFANIFMSLPFVCVSNSNVCNLWNFFEKSMFLDDFLGMFRVNV